MGPYKYKFLRIFKNYIKNCNLDKDKPALILDVGCANGKFMRLFHNHRYNGVDKNANYINELKNKYKNYLYNFHLIDFTKNKLPTNVKFDLVITTHTLAHVSTNEQINLIKKMIFSTKKNKFLIIQINKNYVKTINYIKKNTNIINKIQYGGMLSEIMEPLPNSFHSSLLGNFLNYILSYIDFCGSKNHIMILAKKDNKN
jgi:2-polyprenyl-3-methyl-5-hydroxy-6-metoxy-1,4-benzoquinol methylase